MRAESRGGPRLADLAWALPPWGAALGALGILALVSGDLLVHGWARIDPEFLLAAPRDAGRAGGILPILVATGLVVLVCLAAAVPVGLGTAILLAEYCRGDGRLARGVRFSLDVLAGMPSIVFGLFGNALFCVALGMGFSILSGGLTLACMVLPLLVRSIEEGFRAVPDGYRLGAAALGLTRTATLRRILLPAAVPGIVVGLVLGIGRAVAETAALVFTSGYVDRMPRSLLDSGRTLSVHVLDLAMNVPGGAESARASALVLLALLLAVNAVASFLARRWLGRGVLER